MYVSVNFYHLFISWKNLVNLGGTSRSNRFK